MGSAKYFARDGFFGMFGFPLTSFDLLHRATAELRVQYSPSKGCQAHNRRKTEKSREERNKTTATKNQACLPMEALCQAWGLPHKQNKNSVTSVSLTNSNIPLQCVFRAYGDARHIQWKALRWKYAFPWRKVRLIMWIPLIEPLRDSKYSKQSKVWEQQSRHSADCDTKYRRLLGTDMQPRCGLRSWSDVHAANLLTACPWWCRYITSGRLWFLIKNENVKILREFQKIQKIQSS